MPFILWFSRQSALSSAGMLVWAAQSEIAVFPLSRGTAENLYQQSVTNGEKYHGRDVPQCAEGREDHRLNVPETQVTPEAKFIEDLGADSLDTVELVMALEQAFNTEIPDEEAEGMTTVGDAIAYVEGKLGKGDE